MLLRNSISTTKKFFHKTIQSVKSLFSGGSYERIPKSSPYTNQYPYTKIPFGTDMNNVNTDLDKFYSDFTDRWDTPDDHKAKAKKKNKIKITPPKQAKDEDLNNGSFLNDYQIQRREKFKYNNHNNTRSKENSSNNYEEISRRDHERRSFVVAQKLKEIKMMDINSVDHVLDIEEVLHYYSRLTCSAYLDIVDKFFIDMYAELFGPPVNVTPPSVSSRPIRLSSLEKKYHLGSFDNNSGCDY